jgi:hypothetical protein
MLINIIIANVQLIIITIGHIKIKIIIKDSMLKVLLDMAVKIKIMDIVIIRIVMGLHYRHMDMDAIINILLHADADVKATEIVMNMD